MNSGNEVSSPVLSTLMNAVGTPGAVAFLSTLDITGNNIYFNNHIYFIVEQGTALMTKVGQST